MERLALSYLEDWKDRSSRRPLIVRGARQVGKSTLVRIFADESFDNLVEIDFEREPEMASLFESRSPAAIVRLLSLQFDTTIEPGETLLFLDEIQAAPELLACLRYFHEEMPELHVIAAGSLLELVLRSPVHAVPVGRVEYLHLGPMQFEEFLLAAGKERLVRFIGELPPDGEVPVSIHERLMDLLKSYLVVGGMPGAVAAFLESRSHRECDLVKQSILSTYQDDFGKYGARVSHARLVKVFRGLPRTVGSRFKYVHVDRHERAKDLAAALDLLVRARVAHRVPHSSSNGVPLAAEVHDRKFKVLFLDVGLVLRSCGLGYLDVERAGDVMLVNAGAVCEQLVGQHLLYSREPYEEPRLHFWAREQRNSAAEVDYVIAEGGDIVPIEVKAGKTGTLKSMHLFLQEKHRTLGVRMSSAPPSLLDATTSIPGRDDIPFRLLSLPLYMVGQVRRLVRELGG